MQPHPFPEDPAVSLCPLRYFRDNPSIEAEAFTLHLNWSRGILPVSGGADDQAANFQLVVMAVEHGVQVGRARLQEVERKQAERKARAAEAARSGRR